MIVENWNSNMMEQLDASDPKLTMLGDRGDQKRAFTEEAWRVVHACAVQPSDANQTNQPPGDDRMIRDDG